MVLIVEPPGQVFEQDSAADRLTPIHLCCKFRESQYLLAVLLVNGLDVRSIVIRDLDLMLRVLCVI